MKDPGADEAPKEPGLPSDASSLLLFLQVPHPWDSGGGTRAAV